MALQERDYYFDKTMAWGGDSSEDEFADDVDENDEAHPDNDYPDEVLGRQV